MKVSLNLAQAHSNVVLSETGIDKLIEKIGAQLGAIEGVVRYGSLYDGIVVARVVSCEKHFDADNLTLCKIDDGGITQNVNRDEQGLVQVVCGAPNVREGMTAAWIPPGATVPASINKTPFVLEPREIRGQISNGMLASPSELSLSDNHDGILEIDESEAKPGQPFKQLYGLDDVVIDIENKMFTHRPDCFGILGVARELAGIQHKQFVSPDWYMKGELSEMNERQVQLNVKIETDLVSRFMAVAMKNVSVGPSPIWLQANLARVGLKAINNIVDITNYLMCITGQPLHAYDADKLPESSTLGARLSREGEKVNLLNGKELELLDEGTVVITSGDKVVGIGGVMGGKDTEVTGETKNIIIECANFDMYNIRRTSMRYGLFTDAATRFTKGQSNLQNPPVLAKAVAMVRELAGGMQSSNASDVHNELRTQKPVRVSTHFINDRLGSDLNTSQVSNLLTNVGFDVVLQDELIIKAPFWRTDIEIPEDIVEEVGRLHGFDNLSLVLPTRPAKPATRNQLLELKNKLRTALSAGGANELLTYSFVHGNLLSSVGQSADHAFQLSNALSPDLQYLRMSLTPSLLERVHPNIKSGNHKFALFELGTVHNKLHADDDQGLPKEFPTMAFVVSADEISAPAYYQARAYLDYLAKQLGMHLRYDVIKEALDFPAAKPYDETRSAIITDVKSGQVLGIIGEFKRSVLRNLKLPSATAGFEIGLEEFAAAATEGNYQKLSKYPSVQQDISLRVPSGTTYQQVYELLSSELIGKPDVLATLTPLDSYQPAEDTDYWQVALRLVIAHHKKTLRSEEVNNLLDAAARVAHDKLDVVRI